MRSPGPLPQLLPAPRIGEHESRLDWNFLLSCGICQRAGCRTRTGPRRAGVALQTIWERADTRGPGPVRERRERRQSKADWVMAG